MSVTVDDQPLAIEQLGFQTVGQVLSHLQRDNRLVVNVLIDGRQPDLEHIPTLRQSPLEGHTLFIETADPKQMAAEVLAEVQANLEDADRLRGEACELLQKNQQSAAMQKLSGCFSIWQHTQEAVLKTAQLLRIDLETATAGRRQLRVLLADFAQQLKQIKSALENRDFVLLSDILQYEMDESAREWREALAALRVVAG
jgi:hypothetical protein